MTGKPRIWLSCRGKVSCGISHIDLVNGTLYKSCTVASSNAYETQRVVQIQWARLLGILHNTAETSNARLSLRES